MKNMFNMLKQAQEMKSKFSDLKRNIENTYFFGESSVIFDKPIGEIHNSPTVKIKYPTNKYHIGVLAKLSTELADIAKTINPSPRRNNPNPALIAEFGLGRGSRRGVIGAFAELIGRRYAWMGGFIALTSVMILFYYSVVTGWTLKYFVASLSGALTGSGAEAYWNDYTNSIWQPFLFHIVSCS